MSRLDQHIRTVQNKMALTTLLRALAWGLLVFAGAVWVAVFVYKLFQVNLPRQHVWFWMGFSIAVVVPIAYAVWRRPTRHEAAVAIDERLALKEKFSTALYVRPMKDPFSAAAVKDAERTAENVSLYKRFPIEFPKVAAWTVTIALAALLTAQLMSTYDLFGVEKKRQEIAQAETQKKTEIEHTSRKVLAMIDTAPKAVKEDPEILKIARDLKDMQAKPLADTARAQRRAQQALNDVDNAIKQKIRENANYAQAQNEAKAFKSMSPPSDETGPIADAHRALAKADYATAVEELKKAVNNFDKLEQKDKDKAAQQMKQLAQAINQAANNPQAQQQMQKQLQQMGANQQQAQQIAQAMQKAAAGDKQAQQQVAQAAKQLAQQMNQQAGLTPQQQKQMAQQVQQQMQQMQQQANGQMNAQQLAQAAQALAKAMQQSAQGGQQGQQAQGQKNGQNQPGQQGGQNMANAGQQMQQQLQQMQDIANDAQAQAAAQNNGQGQDGQNGQGQNGQGNGKNQAGNPQGGKWGQNNNNNQGQGFGDGGRAAGGRPNPTEAPYGTKDEMSASHTDEKGKILANTFVKAGSIRGESKAQLHDVLPSVEKEATDEVEEDRIPRGAQKAVKEYFDTLREDTGK